MSSDFDKAVKQLRQAEGNLMKDLDKLETARSKGDSERVPTLHKAAQQSFDHCETCIETAELLRRDYWVTRSNDLEKKLLISAAPLLAELVACRTASGHPGVVTSPVEISRTLIHACSQWMPFSLTDIKIPDEPLFSSALDRADDDLFHGNNSRFRLEQSQKHHQARIGGK